MHLTPTLTLYVFKYLFTIFNSFIDHITENNKNIFVLGYKLFRNGQGTKHWAYYNCSKASCAASYEICPGDGSIVAVDADHNQGDRNEDEELDCILDFIVRHAVDEEVFSGRTLGPSKEVVKAVINSQDCSEEAKVRLRLKIEAYRQRLDRTKRAFAKVSSLKSCFELNLISN